MADITFGQIYQVPYVNTKVTPLEVPTTNPMKLLLISDTHLGAKEKNIPTAISGFIASLKKVIAVEQPTHIFHLGDLVDGSLIEPGPQILHQILTDLESLRLPFYVIGGNHDRDYATLSKWVDTENVKLITSLALKVVVPPIPPRTNSINLFFAHDLGNNYRVRDKFAHAFVTWIKAGCKNTIAPNDWLITGHTHTAFVSVANSVASVGQFSPEVNAFGYAVVNISNELSIITKVLI